MRRSLQLVSAASLLMIALPGQAQETELPQVPAPDPAFAQLPSGYRAEVFASGLTYPSAIEFDDRGNAYIAESGFSYGEEVKARVLIKSPNGSLKEFAAAGLEGPITDLLWHQGRMYVSHKGKISVLRTDGSVRDLVTGLPANGDHHNNQMSVGPDGKIYFGMGTATNSGVVGEDSFLLGWLPGNLTVRDIPPFDIKLVGQVFTSGNPANPGVGPVKTSAFHAFGETAAPGKLIRGNVKSNGTILRMNADGSGLEVYASGFRNPYGVLWAQNGKLYASENGCDIRGSRPIANDMEDLYEVKQGAWYGWPDYLSGIPVTDSRFHAVGFPAPEFLLAQHPPVEKPVASFAPHGAIVQMDDSRSSSFGFKGQLFIGFFGHMTMPMGGETGEHFAHQVIRFDPLTKRWSPFFVAKDAHGGHGNGNHHDNHGGGNAHDAHAHGAAEGVTAGPRRPLDVRFSPDGKELYVVDFGTMLVGDMNVTPIKETGVVWRIVPQRR